MSRAYGSVSNGNGIPEKVINKIFQPFFTTKPTGQGTGLGLSLAYDIVKAHSGEIKVESKMKTVQHLLFNYLLGNKKYYNKSCKSVNPINHGSDDL